jgi:hypothetical protein
MMDGDWAVGLLLVIAFVWTCRIQWEDDRRKLRDNAKLAPDRAAALAEEAAQRTADAEKE